MPRTRYKKAIAASLLCAWTGLVHADQAILKPGALAYAVTGGRAGFGNAAIEALWNASGQRLSDTAIIDRDNGQALKVDELFALALPGKQSITASSMHLLTPVSEHVVPADPRASRLADRLAGKAISAAFGDADGRFHVQSQLIQREGSSYLREIVTITALKHDEPLTGVVLLSSSIDHAEVDGAVKGSPVVAGDIYMGLENPLSDSEMHGRQVTLSMARTLPLRMGRSITYSAVVGVTREGQLRRDFARYVERERAHPYRPLLHYNSWYDISYFTPYTEAEALERISVFGEELSVKRGVKLDSFLFDDGWDDRSGSWGFSEDFPHGFVRLREATAKYGAAPGMWLSPWGGYSTPKDERVQNGKAAGYEIAHGGLALSGPNYYQHFHDTVIELLNEDGVNQFKFDGTGNADTVFPGSRFDSDFAAAIELIKDIRADRPDTFINLTNGHLGVAVLAALCRFDLARRRRRPACRRGHRARAVDHLSRPADLPAHPDPGAAVPTQLADAPRHHLRAAEQAAQYRPGP